jgi:hypothetical protein
MENFDHKSKLRSLVQDPSKPTDLEIGNAGNATYPLDNSVELVCSTLRELQKQVSEEPELVRGTKELINFIQNLRISPPGPTTDEHLQALHPIRHWIHWLPRSLISLSDREPLPLVFLAHYHMVVLAVEAIIPAAPKFLLSCNSLNDSKQQSAKYTTLQKNCQNSRALEDVDKVLRT